MSQKAAKMCKSPKNILLTDKVIEYEHLSTNCTIVGSNNLHLVKKQPAGGAVPQSPSPGAYKSPSPQAAMKPPTPQPAFPVMQIINPVLAGGRQLHHHHQPVSMAATVGGGGVIKLKPPLNILPKPAGQQQQSGGGGGGGGAVVTGAAVAVARQSPRPASAASPATAHIQMMPAGGGAPQAIVQQPLLLNQMPMLAAAPGVRFILQPQTAKIAPQVQQVQQVQQTPQGLILQPAGAQSLLQLQAPSPARSQPMVRVLTNGVGIPATTYVTQMGPVQNLQTSLATPTVVAPSPKRRPAKKKKQRLDLANIMKLSGIGDDDDVLFESDASQSEGDATHSTITTPAITSTPHMEKKTVTTATAAVVPPSIQPPPQPTQMMLPQQLQQQLQQQMAQQSGTPIVQVLNHQPQPQQLQTPFGGFSIAPNFTLGANGLMAVPTQRSNGGFKLALGEDGRLVLQHDPTLNQDLNAQLLLQSIFGLNGGCGSLVLQPSIDQQIHSQTVQTIQQQSVQTIQQQTVQSQTIQTVQHQIVQPQALQSIQSQLQGQIQSLLQQQNIIQQQQQPGITTTAALQGLMTSQAQQVHHNAVSHAQIVRKPTPAASPANSTLGSRNPTPVASPAPTQAPPTPTFTNHAHSTPNQFFNSPAGTTSQAPQVLKVQPFQKSQPPVQTVHPIHHQAQQGHTHNNAPTAHAQALSNQPAPTSYVVNLTPDQLEQLKRNGQLTVNGQTIFMQRPANKDISEKKTSPKIKPMKKTAPVTKIKEVQNHVSKPNTNNLDKIINSVAGACVRAFTPTAATGLDAPTSQLQAVQQLPSPVVQLPTPPIVQMTSTPSMVQMTSTPTIIQQSSIGQQPMQQVQQPVTSVQPIGQLQTAPSIVQLPTQASHVTHLPTSVVHHQMHAPGKVKTAAIIQPSIVLQQQQQVQHLQQLQHVPHLQGQVQQIQGQVQNIPQMTTQTKLVTAVAPATPVVTPTTTKVMISPRCAPGTPVSLGGAGITSVSGVITSTPSGMVVTPITPNGHTPGVHHIVVSSAGGGMSLISAVPVSLATTMTVMTASPSMVTSVVPSGLPSVIPAGTGVPMNIVQQQVVSMPGLTPVTHMPKAAKVESTQSHDVERFLGQLMDDHPSQVVHVKLPTSQAQQIQAQPHNQIKLQKVQVQPLHMSMQMIQGQLSGQQEETAAVARPQTPQRIISQSPAPPCVANQSHSPHVSIGQSQQASSACVSQSQQLPTVTSHAISTHAKPQPITAASLPTSTNQQSSITHAQNQPQTPMIVSSPLVLPQIPPNNQGQRIHTIQLTPQKQQHLKSIQLQIQTLSTRMQPGNVEMQKALNVLFQEQQKILASGKLLPPDKVFYHGNQIIVNNSSMVKNEVLSPPLKPVAAPPTEVKPVLIQPKIEPSKIQSTVTSTSAPTIVTSAAPSTAISTQVSTAQAQATSAAQAQAQANANKVALYKRAQLIEQQMNTDQNGAIKPDIHTPFRDKADACKRLIRYHCFEQPVLSEKDLSKADEIFELTARHFIGKFGRMVDKYRYLLHKESQRHVQTSELMMLDRMFLSEEQQSLIKLRQEIDELQTMQQQELSGVTSGQQEMSAEDYDEWACIQRELGCLPEGVDTPTSAPPTLLQKHNAANPLMQQQSMITTTSTSTPTTSTSATTTQATAKRPLTSQSTQETQPIKKQRCDKPAKATPNGLQSGEATRFVLKSSSLGSLNGETFTGTSNEVRHNIHATSCATIVNYSATQTSVAANNYIQQQRFNIQQQQQFLNATHAQNQLVQHTAHAHYQQNYNCSMTSMSSSGSSASTRSNNEENDSIDEQVQSAIDSILNLQQGNLDLDETMQNMLS